MENPHLLKSWECHESSLPVSFGRKICWLAFNTTAHKAVVETMMGPNERWVSTNMALGVEAAYRGFTFIFPVIEEWVLVIRKNFMNEPRYLERMVDWSAGFGEVHAYESHSVSDYSTWIKCKSGRLERAFSADNGKVFMNNGVLTNIECLLQKEIITEIPVLIHDAEGLLNYMAGEENTFRVAQDWSINPVRLEEYNVKNLGSLTY